MASTWGNSWGTSWGTSWDLAFATVPDVTGLTQAQAVAAIEAAGFVAAVVTDSSNTVAAGLVISQDPTAGSQASAGSTVTITVSTGIGTNPLDPKFLGRAHNTRVRWLRKKDEAPTPEPVEEIAAPPEPEPEQKPAVPRSGGLRVPKPEVQAEPVPEIKVALPAVVVPIRPATPPAAEPTAAAAAPAPSAPPASPAPPAPPAPVSTAEMVQAVAQVFKEALSEQIALTSKALGALESQITALRKMTEELVAKEAIRDRGERNRRRADAIARKLLNDDEEGA